MATVIGKVEPHKQQAKLSEREVLFLRFPALRLFHDGPVTHKVTDKRTGRVRLATVALSLGDLNTARTLLGCKAATKRGIQQAILRLS